MKPILYAETETDFITQGLGTLYDAISCKVTEVRNGQYELSMTYPVKGLHFADIKHSRIIMAKPSDSGDPQPFRIYNITKPINGRVTVRAEHISYQMSHIPVKPFTGTSAAGTLALLPQKAFETCPFTFWTDKTTTAQFKLKEPASMRSILGGTKGSILDVYGGEWEFDVFDAKLHNNRGSDNGVTLRYGKNITDLTQEENIANTYTGIVPFWSGQTDTGEDQIVVTDQPVYAQNANLYPYHRTKVVDFSGDFDTAPTKAQLTTAANSYITANNIGIPAVSLKVSFVALWQSEEYKDIANVERINLCDTVTVEFPLLDVSVKAKVIQTVWDVLADRYESIEIGEARSTLASTITETASEIANKATANTPTLSYLERAINHATELITGGLGGYVYLKPNADGQPEEILIMDNPDYLQAANLWRWNRNGLGFSSNGYNGTYATAITADGKINADFINVGTLNAALINVVNLTASAIYGGTLTLGGQNNDNGLMRILNASGTEIGRWSNAGIQIVSGVIQLGLDANNNPITVIDNNGRIDTAKLYATYGAFGDLTLQDSSLRASSPYVPTTSNVNRVYVGKYGVAISGVNSNNYGRRIEIQEGRFSLFQQVISNGAYNEAFRLQANSSTSAASQNSTYAEFWLGKSGLGSYPPELFFKGNTTGHFWYTNETWIDVDNAIDISYSVTGESDLTFWPGRSLDLTHSDVYLYKDLSVRGTKSRIVDTNDYSRRLLYCYETAVPTFGDIGEGLICEDGYCYVTIDPIFSETVNTGQYQVFLQKYGDGDCYVSERHPGYFVVCGTSDMAFGWEIKARQSDFDQLRLNKVSDRIELKNETNYGKEAWLHIEHIQMERNGG